MTAASPQHQQAAEGLASLGSDIADIDRYRGEMTPQQQQSPGSPTPKNVAFELLLNENSKIRARIPMRVQIFPHDTTDSIVTTVKNFYGIYDGVSGVSFEDENGITLIARYENLRNNMTVYVRVIPVHSYIDTYEPHYQSGAPIDSRKRPSLGEPFQMVPTAGQGHPYGPPTARPLSRTRRPSTSPSGRGRRSTSQHKAFSRNDIKSRGSSAHGSYAEDSIAGYSDSEGGHGSISGSRKARSEQFASSEISMDNIVQESRRKKPKFESSELPLFAPPQVPLTTSTSSISPQRRSTVNDGEPSPFARPTHRPVGNRPPLPSPQSYGHSEHGYRNESSKNPYYNGAMFPDNGIRSRLSGGSAPGSGSGPALPGVLPTPDPTIASCISDEDVAMQLIRLGDASNFSHGRNSTSTMDDAFSGAADASSSTGATSDDAFSENEDDQELPPRSRSRVESSPLLPPGRIKHSYKGLDDILPSYDSTEISADEGEEYHQTSDPIKDEYYDGDYNSVDTPRAKKQKVRSDGATSSKNRASKSTSTKGTKNAKHRANPVARKSKASISSASEPKHEIGLQTLSPAPSRKTSGPGVNFQQQLAADEEDLSSKPRCQRCRKSKKGCDRQRPCGRCKDAGIGLEGCISEDEGNGRKGRYGRHMGVPIKKTLEPEGGDEFLGLPTPTHPAQAFVAGGSIEKNKKRKR